MAHGGMSLLGRSAIAFSVMAALAYGPALAMRVPSSPDMRKVMLGAGGGKGKRKHRCSGTYSGNGRGNPSWNTPHQGKQERLRRLVGGFALTKRVSGMNKAAVINHLDRRAASMHEAREAALELA